VMDEKSILLMSEELRAAMGSGVKRLETPISAEAPAIRIEGRIVKFASLRSGRARLVIETRGASVGDILPSEVRRSVAVVGSASLSLESVRIVRVTVDNGRTRRITLILDAVGPK